MTRPYLAANEKYLNPLTQSLSSILTESINSGTISVDDHSTNTVTSRDKNTSEDDFKDPPSQLRDIKLKNINNPILAYIKVNSIRNKHSDLFSIIDSNVEIVTIAETKLDSSFPSAQFIVNGYSAPYRKDRNANGGGLLVYIKEGIPSCELKNHSPMSNSFDVIVIEINFRKSKWLLINAYKPPSVNNSLFCDQISRLLDFYSLTYKNIVLMGDFNMRLTDNNFHAFYESHDLYNLIKEKNMLQIH